MGAFIREILCNDQVIPPVARKGTGPASGPFSLPSEHGAGIPDAPRAYLERWFGQRFGQVRIHTGPGAAASARLINADAYTVGSDVYFGAGKADFRKPEGIALLGHELTHVLQTPGVRAKGGIGSVGGAAEQTALANEARLLRTLRGGGRTTPVPAGSAGAGGVQRRVSSTGVALPPVVPGPAGNFPVRAYDLATRAIRRLFGARGKDPAVSIEKLTVVYRSGVSAGVAASTGRYIPFMPARVGTSVAGGTSPVGVASAATGRSLPGFAGRPTPVGPAGFTGSRGVARAEIGRTVPMARVMRADEGRRLPSLPPVPAVAPPSVSRAGPVVLLGNLVLKHAGVSMLAAALHGRSLPPLSLKSAGASLGGRLEDVALANEARILASLPHWPPSPSGRGDGGEGPRRPGMALLSRAGGGASAVGLDDAALRGFAGRGGSPMPSGIQTAMEGRFGADFSNVRVHADSQADALSHSLGARALTYGNDIFFRRGAWAPGSTESQALLGHELAHVVQQREGRVGAPQHAGALGLGPSHLERQARDEERSLRRVLGRGRTAVAVRELVPEVTWTGSPSMADEARLSDVFARAVARAREAIAHDPYLRAVDVRLGELTVDATVDLARGEWAAAEDLGNRIARAVRTAVIGASAGGHAAGGAAQGVVFLANAFGDPTNQITFSWEMEGGDPRIFNYYRPEELTDEQWFAIPIHDRRNWLQQKNMSYEGMPRTAKAPDYLKKTLHNEVGGALGVWETCTNGCVTEIEELVKQARWAQENLDEQGGFHFHVAFKHKPEYADAIADYLLHGNEFITLDMFASHPSNIHHKYLAPMGAPMAKQIRQGIASGSPENNKFYCLGFRTGLYKGGGDYSDSSIVGLEVRAINYDVPLAERFIKATVGYLEDPKNAKVSYGGATWTGAEMHEAERLGPQTFERLDPKVQEFLKKAADVAADKPFLGSPLLERWTVPMIAWENRSMIPEGHKAKLRELREKFVGRLKALAERYGDQVTAEAQRQIEQEVYEWARRANLSQYY